MSREPEDGPGHAPGAVPEGGSGTVLEMRSIVKRFTGVTALADVTLAVRRGEIHALCGENGAASRR